MTSTVLSGPSEEGADYGPGLWRRTLDDGSSVVTNIRLAGTPRKAGSGLINFATALLFALGIGLFVVSFKGQFAYVFAQKHVSSVSVIEALSLDAGMAIFSLLGLGMSRAGKPALVERVLIVLCALGSAAMNLGAADLASPRSVAAYCVPPVFLALVVDRVISVVRRHYLGDEERSPWAVLGRGLLYGLRFLVAPKSTARGIRRALLDATPVPEPVKPAEPVATVPATIELPELGPVQAIATRPTAAIEAAPRATPRKRAKASKSRKATGGPSKTSQFLELVTDSHGELHGIDLGSVYAISKAHAPTVGLHEGSARSALRAAILRARGE
jgi:hypothetical protein